MTADQAFKWYRAYKLFFAGTYDLARYGSNVRNAELSKQNDRSFFYRIAQRLPDNQIHALYTRGFFYNPRAHISEFGNPDAQSAALVFASRQENGTELLKKDLYELIKQLRKEDDVIQWLYGDENTSIPTCLQAVINGEIALDCASLLFLIPIKELDYHWVNHWTTRPDSDFGLGAKQWIQRLEKVDQILYMPGMMQRQSWRQTTHKLARAFWTALEIPQLSPKKLDTPATLFS